MSAPERQMVGRQVGRQVGRYELVEQVGSGGMSVVWKAKDPKLDREVALKLLHPHLAQKEDSRRRFSREARAVAKLHHPNILEIFDFSDDSAAESFIVTEFIRGCTLRAFAEKTAFEPPEIAAMAVHELASALEHAHAAGIIHRDLKPENVMIRDDGVIKLMDFGIAKVIDRDERMTQTGALVGSPAHMAPEIIEGQEATREADIFSLGTILYSLCCHNELPFVGNNTTQTLKRILDGQYTDPRSKNEAVSDDLAKVIEKCLAREPTSRYPEAGQLKQALADVLKQSGVEHVSEELEKFLKAPETYRVEFKAALVKRLVDDAQGFAKSRRRNYGGTIKRLNRILALEPGNEVAQQLLAQTRQKDRRRKMAKDAAKGLVALSVLCAASLGGWKGFVAWHDHRAIAVVEPPPKPVVVVPPTNPVPPPAIDVRPEPKVVEPVKPPKPDPKLVPKGDPKKLPKPVEVAKVETPVEPAAPPEEREVILDFVPKFKDALGQDVGILADVDVDGKNTHKVAGSWTGKITVGDHVAHARCSACLDVPYPFAVMSSERMAVLRPFEIRLRLRAQVVAEVGDTTTIVKVDTKEMQPTPNDPKKRALIVGLPPGSASAPATIELTRDGKSQQWEQTLSARQVNVVKVPER